MKPILGVYCKEYPDKSYLHKEDIDNLEKLKTWMKQLDTLYLTYDGYEYIKTHFSSNELLEVATDNSYKNAEDFTYDLKNYVLNEVDKVIVWNDKDVLKNLSGIPAKRLPVDFRVIFVGPKLPFQIHDFKYYLTLIKENNDKNKGKFDPNFFDFIWNADNGVERFFDVDLQNESYFDYDLINIYYKLSDYDEDIETRIKTTEKELDTYIKEQGLPLYERTIPTSWMRVILFRLNRDPKSKEEYKKAYIVFLDKLASIHDRLALEIKASAYYGGNEYVKEDYKISEQCFLELLSFEFNDKYADSLGNIYYYGRVNNGTPEYDKAFQYFLMSSIAGNVDATYKLGEMYKYGYGVVKNEAVCKWCNSFLYPRVLNEFYDYPNRESLADVAFRLGSFYTEKETAHIGARLFLEALLSISTSCSRIDPDVKKSIQRCLFDIYKEHKEEIISHNNLKYSMMHFDEFTITRNGYDLLVESKERRLLFDLEKLNAALVYSFHVFFKGEILKDIDPEDNRCDEIFITDNGYIHFKHQSKTIFIIENKEIQIQFKRSLIQRQDDENVYHVAICQYTQGKGRKYMFLIDADGEIDDEWIVQENDKDIYPMEFTYQKGYELSCDAYKLKHIVRKK